MDNKLLLEYAAFSGDWSVIRGNITVEDLGIFKEKGGNLLETQGGNGNILKLPPDLIGEEGLLYKDEELCIKTIQVLAENGALSLVPKKYLTKENLCAKNSKFGYTTFHYAARHGCLNDIPKNLRDEKNLTAKANNDQTPLELAVGMVKALRKCEDPHIKQKVQKIKNGINIILSNLSSRTLEKMQMMPLNKDYLPLIKSEITRRNIIKNIQEKKNYIEL